MSERACVSARARVFPDAPCGRATSRPTPPPTAPAAPCCRPACPAARTSVRSLITSSRGGETPKLKHEGVGAGRRAGPGGAACRRGLESGAGHLSAPGTAWRRAQWAGAGEEGRENGDLHGDVGHGLTEGGGAALEVVGRQVLGEEHVAADVLASLLRRRGGRRGHRYLGLPRTRREGRRRHASDFVTAAQTCSAW